MPEIKLEIPRITKDPITLTPKNGDQLFIVGPNGSGKSALIQWFFSNLPFDRVKWIPAHRQLWSESGRLDLTPASRQEYEEQMLNHNRKLQARYKDNNSYQRRTVSAILFDLVNKENNRARSIAYQVDNDDCSEAQKISAESPPPFDQINELLNLATLTVNIENSHSKEILASHPQCTPFSVVETSDGERSAMIIAVYVITAKPGTVFLIDEPERHLHRSIIQPFLSALFKLRRDCTFIISTHEVALPVTNQEARVLMLRSCKWSDNQCTAWDAEVLEPGSELPEELRRAILGSRKRILFVEGDSDGSLDSPLYTVLFRGLSVIPRGSCGEVQKTVLELREFQGIHDIEAFGLIDRDNRSCEEVDELAEMGVFALEVYSVEALYYCSDAIAAVAHQHANSLGVDVDELIKSAKQEAFKVLKDHAERMAALMCVRQVRKTVLSALPDWQSIIDNPAQTISVPVDPQLYSNELNHFNKLVENEQLDRLVARYPLHKSGTFNSIAKALRCPDKTDYERMVLVQIQRDNGLAEKLKKRIGQLSLRLEQMEDPETI